MSNRKKLSQEILGLFAATALISVFFYFFLSITAGSIVQNYCDKKGILLTVMQIETIEFWITDVSFLTAIILFVVLFLFLAGQKIGYINEIIRGIDALGEHRMDYEIPLEGNNELTELAEHINSLSKTERELQQKEAVLREEREAFIRELSHDIRTPLTSIISYTEYMQAKESLEAGEVESYLALMRQKGEQIKCLTARLIDGETRALELFEDGRFLMEQLADEWEATLEDGYICNIHCEKCPKFSGEFDVQELRRVFDNLASNVRKYAEAEKEVFLEISEQAGYLTIVQENSLKQYDARTESNKIGLESIRKIAERYGGTMSVEQTEDKFTIIIHLFLL